MQRSDCVPFGRRIALPGHRHGESRSSVARAFADPKPVEAREHRAKPAGAISAGKRRRARRAGSSDYYLAPCSRAVALMLPPGFERKPLTFYESLLSAEELGRAACRPGSAAVLDLSRRARPDRSKEIERDVEAQGRRDGAVAARRSAASSSAATAWRGPPCAPRRCVMSI